MSKGLYIHIPFCKYICSYCDFGKKYIKNQPVDQYIEALCTEIDMYKPFTDINSIYIGGGTPSSLNNQQLTKLFNKLQQVINFEQIEEFSFELNPDDVTTELLTLLKANHINRLSIGAQTLNDQILESLHRMHTGAEVVNAVKLANQLFDNVSVDFMFNLPNQTIDDIKQTFEFIRQANIKHISYYGLIFEDHTILSTENHQYWSEDYESEVYTIIQTELNKLGFEQYEISNYGKPGYKSVHNIHYWDRDEYYGIGLSSSGQLANERYTNTYSLKAYVDAIMSGQLPIKDQEVITSDDELFEKIMLGLRYYKFVEVGIEVVEYVRENSFLHDKFDITETNLRLKPEFYYISNQIILDIIERIEC